jgi:hypothetical protein
MTHWNKTTVSGALRATSNSHKRIYALPPSAPPVNLIKRPSAEYV